MTKLIAFLIIITCSTSLLADEFKYLSHSKLVEIKIGQDFYYSDQKQTINLKIETCNKVLVEELKYQLMTNSKRLQPISGSTARKPSNINNQLIINDKHFYVKPLSKEKKFLDEVPRKMLSFIGQVNNLCKR
jgi:hypothetical protein